MEDVWLKTLYQDDEPVTVTIVNRLLEAIQQYRNTEDKLFLCRVLITYLPNTAFLLPNEIALANSVFDMLLKLSCGSHEHPVLRCAAIRSLTSLCIQMDALNTRLHDAEQLIATLLDLFAVESPKGIDKSLRQTACQCLAEFEVAFPCILVGSLLNLISWAKTENSCIKADLLSLAALVLVHGCEFIMSPIEKQEKINTGLSMFGRDIEGNFSMGNDDNGVPVWLTVATSSLIQTFVSACLFLSDVAVIGLINRLDPIFALKIVPTELLCDELSYMQDTGSPLLMAGAAQLVCKYPELLHACDDLISSIAAVVTNSALEAHQRIQAVTWLDAIIQKNKKIQLAGNKAKWDLDMKKIISILTPRPFDSYELIVSMLTAMSGCFWKEEVHVPDLTVLLEDLQEFSYYDPDSPKVSMYFGVLKNWIENLPDLRPKLFKFVQDIASGSVRFLPCIIAMSKQMSPRVRIEFLSAMTELFSTMNTELLPKYFDLIKYALSVEGVSPVPSIVALVMLVQRTSVCRTGDFIVGNEIMCSCRIALLHHKLVDIYAPMVELLRFMYDNYDNFYIRDRSCFFLQLITHLPGQRIQSILTAEVVSKNFVQQQIKSTENVQDFVESHQKSAPAFLEITRSNIKSLFCSIPKREKELSEEGSRKFDPKLFDIKDGEYPLVVEHMKSLYEYPAYFEIPIMIRYKKGWEPVGNDEMKSPSLHAARQEPARLDPIFGVSITFEKAESGKKDDPDIYKKCDAVTIPYMKHGYRGTFPNAFPASIVLRPYAPLPSRFTPMLTFNDINGDSRSAELDMFEVAHVDLFLPLDDDTSSTRLFNELWKFYEEKPCYKGPKGAADPFSMHIFKAVNVPFVKVRQCLLKKYTRFVFQDEADEEASVVNVGILLPPRFHMLIKFKEQTREVTNAEMYSDFWRIFSYVDDIFNYMFK